MSLVDLNGAFGLHIHSNFSLFLRTGTDIDMARHAAEHGLAGILLKNHFESTAGRARLAEQKGVQSLILSSDAGRPRTSLPAEVLRWFATCLMEKGISQEKTDRMTEENPARLLRL